MTGKNNNDKVYAKNTGFIIGFFVVAVVSVIVCVFCKSILDSNNKTSKKEVSNSSNSAITTIATTINEEEIITTQPEPEHEEMIFVYDDSGREAPDLNIVLDKSSNKTYKMNLRDLASNGDTIKRFRFIFSAEDGASYLGEVKGAYGVSLVPGSDVATDDSWYQSPDFSVYADGSYCEVICDVPGEVASAINIETGKLMIGYWWSDQQTIRLERVICEKVSFAELPSDGVKKYEVNIPINFNNDETKKYKIPINDLIPEGHVPEFLAISIRNPYDKSIGKFTGSIGVSTDTLFGGFYCEENMVIYEDSPARDLTWIVPETVKKAIDYEGDLEISFWWGESAELVIEQIYVQYSKS